MEILRNFQPTCSNVFYKRKIILDDMARSFIITLQFENVFIDLHFLTFLSTFFLSFIRILSYHFLLQAKLLPPALAECYKILTGDSDTKEKEILPADASQHQSIAVHLLSDSQSNSQQFETASVDGDVYTQNDADEQSAGTEAEDEDSGFNVSQDKFGNYVINMDEVTSPRLEEAQTDEHHTPLPCMSRENRLTQMPRKKNVLLPKRRQHHLSVEHDSEGSQPESDMQSPPVKDINSTQSAIGGEDGSLTGVCNICGIRFTGKPVTWWYNLNSLLAGFENITVTIALRVGNLLWQSSVFDRKF